MNVKPIYYTIIKPLGNRYNNEIKIADQPFIVNTAIDIEDHHYVNRVGIVVQTPNYEVPWNIGDKVLVHHNVFREFWTQFGHLATSASLVEDNHFKADAEQIFAKEVNGEWETFDKWTLIEPDFDNELHGTCIAGRLKGNKVLFKPSSEYRFDVDGKIFYKTREKNITATIL